MSNFLPQIHRQTYSHLRPKSRKLGLTLVELMMVLLILGILTLLAAPSFNSVMRNLRASSEANAVVSALRFARAEAMKRGQPVSITPLAGQTTLSNGWVIFVDPTNSIDPTLMGTTTATGQLYTQLAVRDDVAPNMVITFNSGCTGATAAAMTFSRLGDCGNGALAALSAIVGAQSTTAPGSIDLNTRRAVCMSSGGRIRVVTPAPSTAAANVCP